MEIKEVDSQKKKKDNEKDGLSRKQELCTAWIEGEWADSAGGDPGFSQATS